MAKKNPAGNLYNILISVSIVFIKNHFLDAK